MLLRSHLLFAGLIFLAVDQTSAQELSPESGSPIATVERFVEAFNEHDVEKMLELVHQEIQWFSLSGDSIGVETEGAVALAEGMRGYFAAIPSSRSTIEEIMEAGRFVSVRERVEWEGKSGTRTQSALAVYEIEDGLIRRVWYYPAQK